MYVDVVRLMIFTATLPFSRDATTCSENQSQLGPMSGTTIALPVAVFIILLYSLATVKQGRVIEHFLEDHVQAF